MVRDRQRPALSLGPLAANSLPTIGNIVFVSLLAILALRFGSGLLLDADSGYHIRAGELILDTWTIPRLDPFSYHLPPLPWTAHEWLSEAIMAAVFRLFGLTGVVLFFAVLLAAIHWLLYRVLRAQSNDIILCVAVVLLAAATSSSHWLARPHIFSLALILIWYELLNRFQYRHERTLIYLPPIMLLWVNLHGGYIMGLVLLGIYLAGNLFDAVFAAPTMSANAKRKAGLLCGCAAATVLATLINPFGYKILIFPFELVADRLIMDNIKEFMSPDFHGRLPFKYMLLAAIAALALARTPLNLIECGLLTLTTYMALYSARHVSLFAIIAAPILLKAGESIVDRFATRWSEFYRSRNANLGAVDAELKGGLWPSAATLLIAGLALTGSLRYEFDETVHPVAAVEFLKREPIGGRMFNNDEFGDYLIYAAWPQYRVFIDGRNDMYRDTYNAPYYRISNALPGWREALEKFEIDWIFFNTHSVLAAALTGSSDWQPVYSDRTATIFVRNSPANRTLLDKYPGVTVHGRS
jgi:hypothetical protein